MGMKEVFLLPDDCSDSQKISCELEKRFWLNTLRTSRAEALSVIGVPPMSPQK
jgi:hypothetical protein